MLTQCGVKLNVICTLRTVLGKNVKNAPHGQYMHWDWDFNESIGECTVRQTD